MGMEKLVTTLTGQELTYHKIVAPAIDDIEDTLEGYILSYKNRAWRDSNKKGFAMRKFFTMKIDGKQGITDTKVAGMDNLAYAYPKVMALPEWEGAVSDEVY